MANHNKKLHGAKEQKKDEFYTRLEDIETEIIQHPDYVKQFKHKTVYCNCDNPEWSNFYKFFVRYFDQLGLKKLITTHYAVETPQTYMLEYYGETDVDGNPITTKTNLWGTGDFRSAECVEILKSADIVVTNPPFSLFRDFIDLLIRYNKKFLIIGHQNAIGYKEIFPLIQNGKLWLGYGFSGNVGFFSSPYKDIAISSQHKDGLIRVSGVMWFTNIEIDKRHELYPLTKQYVGNEGSYPKYDNYNAIEIGQSKEIPKDYMEVMGVPITFLSHYCPEQFEIVGFRKGTDGKDLILTNQGKQIYPYSRILIKRK